MGVDTMEVPVDTGAEKQITNTPLKPTERIAPSPLVKQITKAGWRAGNPEGAQRMIAELQEQEVHVPPKLELPQHESESVSQVAKDMSVPLLRDRIAGLKGKNEQPSLLKRVINNAPLVGADRVQKIKEHIANRNAAENPVSTTTPRSEVAAQPSELAMSAQSSSGANSGDAKTDFWNGFDVSQLPPQSALKDLLVGKNGMEATSATTEPQIGPAPDGYLQEQVDAFNASLVTVKEVKPEGTAGVSVTSRSGESEQVSTVEKSTVAISQEAGKAPEDIWKNQEKAFDESLKPVKAPKDDSELSKNTLDTWGKAKEEHEEYNAAEKKAEEDAKLTYKSGLFSTQATLDRFSRESKEMRGISLDARDEVLDAVQKLPVKTGAPLETSEQQRAWYEKVQGPAPDRPAPSTTTSYKSREATAAAPPVHIGPEASAMRAAEDKTATAYAKWKELANADRLAEQLQTKQPRLRSLRRVVAAGLISTGVIMGIDVNPVLAPGVGSSPALSTESGTLPIEAMPVATPVQTSESPKPAEKVAKSAEPIVKAPEESPKPAEPIQMPEFDTTTDKESEKDGMAYILNIDHNGDSISGSWNEQKIPGIETPEEAKDELSNPVVVAALLSANPDVFIDNKITQAEIDALIVRLANGDQKAIKEANEKILDHVKIGDKILTFDKAGFDELEQHLIENVRQASASGQVDKATVWIKLHAELMKQKEAAMKSPEPVPYDVIVDDKVGAQTVEGADNQLPNITDVPNTGSGGVQKAPGGIRYQIAKFFKGIR